MAALDVWSVYLVRTAAGALYTGITTDVRRRVAEHGAGAGAKALRGRGPLELVYRKKLGPRALALRVERRLKALPRAAKEALVRAAPTRLALLAHLELDVQQGA